MTINGPKTYDWLRAVREADRSVLPFGTRGVLAILADGWMDQQGGSAWPSLATLAKACGLTPRMVSKHLAPAFEAGFLRREGGRTEGRSTRYFAMLPAGESPGREKPVTCEAGFSPQVDDAVTSEARFPGVRSPLPATNPGPTQDNPSGEEGAVDVGADERAGEAAAAFRASSPVVAVAPVLLTAGHRTEADREALHERARARAKRDKAERERLRRDERLAANAIRSLAATEAACPP